MIRYLIEHIWKEILSNWRLWMLSYIYQPIMRKEETLQIKNCKRNSRKLKPQPIKFENQIVEWLKMKKLIIHKKHYTLTVISSTSRWRKKIYLKIWRICSIEYASIFKWHIVTTSTKTKMKKKRRIKDI